MKAPAGRPPRSARIRRLADPPSARPPSAPSEAHAKPNGSFGVEAEVEPGGRVKLPDERGRPPLEADKLAHEPVELLLRQALARQIRTLGHARREGRARRRWRWRARGCERERAHLQHRAQDVACAGRARPRLLEQVCPADDLLKRRTAVCKPDIPPVQLFVLSALSVFARWRSNVRRSARR